MSDRCEFDVHYYDREGNVSHSYREKWTREPDMHCVGCGEMAVWVAGDGDYYLGPEYMCALCGVVFHSPTWPCGDAQSKQRVGHLRPVTTFPDWHDRQKRLAERAAKALTSEPK